MSENEITSLLAQGIDAHRGDLLKYWERAAARRLSSPMAGSAEIPCFLEIYLQEVCARLLERNIPDDAPMDSLSPYDRVNLFLVGEEAIAEKLEQICGNPSAQELLALRRELNGVFNDMIRHHTV